MLGIGRPSGRARWLFGASAILAASGAFADRSETVRVEDARPVWAAVSKMSQMYGYTVTYEDPVLVFPGDVHDFEETRGRVHDPSKPRLLVARHGSFAFTYSVDARTNAPDATKVFKSILKAARQAGYYFRYYERDGVFHFVPTSIRGVTGAQSPYTPFLDKRITFPAGKRSLLQFVAEVLKAAEKGRDVPLEFGAVPPNVMVNTEVLDGADGQPARELLSKVLRKARSNMTWDLLCMPKPLCSLNIWGIPPMGFVPPLPTQPATHP